jgi:hypothetical protein
MNREEPTEGPSEGAVRILEEIRAGADELRRLTLGLGAVIVLAWLAATIITIGVATRICCLRGLFVAFGFGAPGLLSSLVVAVAIVSVAAISTGRSRESRALQGEWSSLSVDSSGLLSVHLLERTGAWRDALRRNLEATLVCGILLPFLAFLLALLLADEGLLGGYPGNIAIVVVAVSAGFGTFAALQLVSVLASGRRALREIALQRRRALDSLVVSGISRDRPPAASEDVRGDSGEASDRVAAVEAAVLGRERDARRAASIEREIGVGVVGVAAVGLLLLAVGPLWTFTASSQPTAFPSSLSYPQAAAGLALSALGFIGLGWATSAILRTRSGATGGTPEDSRGSGETFALAHLDEAVDQLDRARTIAGRCRNAAALAVALILGMLLFVPGPYALPSSTAVIEFVLGSLSLPLMLLVVLWTAYRLDRVERLQAELRQWVRALIHVERTFWERF